MPPHAPETDPWAGSQVVTVAVSPAPVQDWADWRRTGQKGLCAAISRTSGLLLELRRRAGSETVRNPLSAGVSAFGTHLISGRPHAAILSDVLDLQYSGERRDGL
nr:hypothetical protein GCM10010200_025320 [Actinomadura rugatobispora]